MTATSSMGEGGRFDRHPVLSVEIGEKNALTVRARAFVFSDPRSRALIPIIERTAPSDANILITGETGTGKELVARYVHDLSGRSKRPFVAINCGAFSESLVEGELFGYEKGAFTGATSTRPGWFETADGGTLFLDEIGDLPLPLQVKLLRVLQEREVTRLGARRPIPLDIRLIAATNVDLQKAVEAGRFREDLFYRLQVVMLPLLPLRERRADILPLARHFMEIYGDRLRVSRLDLTASAEDVLFRYSWPGNIRELENCVHRATLICRGGLIEPADLGLPSIAFELPINVAPAMTSLPQMERDVEVLLPTLLDQWFAEEQPNLLKRVTAACVKRAFAQSDGNQVQTAALLGVTRDVVRTHLKNVSRPCD